MEQLILHLVGDYVTQNHWMANRKTSSTFAALVHVTLYSLPFLLLGPSWAAFGVIAGTHFLIDRFRLAKYWCAFWGVGCEGWVAARWRLATAEDYTFSTEPEPAPLWLSVWLLIIVDNTFHLAINYSALRWL